jgi:pimeloyl-ACP methyl ester carboxylesterase
VDRSSFYLAEDETKIWHGTVGTGPALVLCDGLACDGFIWPYVVDHFLEHFTVVRWHYRGHGMSDDPPDNASMTVENLCADLNGVFDALEIDRAILAGHSMGVQVVLQYADLYPERVDGLIPICGSYKRPLDTLHGTDLLLRALPRLKRLVETSPEMAQNLWKTVVPSRFSHAFAMLTEVNAQLARGSDFLPYLEHVADMNVEVFLAMLEGVANHSTEECLPDIDAPTLVVAGDRDEITPLYRSEEMHELLPDSELLVLEGGTHVAPIELPDPLNAAIETFLVEHGLLDA